LAGHTSGSARMADRLTPPEPRPTTPPTQTEIVSNLQEEFFTTRVVVFLLLLSIMSEIYRRNLQHNRHKVKIYNRRKPEVTVNIGWRSVIIIHDIIYVIFIIIFTNISKWKTKRQDNQCRNLLLWDCHYFKDNVTLI
jgi:hypothetical protein